MGMSYDLFSASLYMELAEQQEWGLPADLKELLDPGWVADSMELGGQQESGWVADLKELLDPG